MIVKDGVATLERAIASVRPHVEEVCVYDTGSTDGTLELLDKLAGATGAPIRVKRGKWRDDYGWALEEAFALATSEWLLRLDDDETLVGGVNLRRLAELPTDVTHAYVLWQARGRSWRRRLTRAGACRWRGRFHEELEPVGDELAFVAALPHALRIEHPVGDPEAQREHDETALAAIAADPDASPWLRGFYGAVALARAGDELGAEAALRGFLNETAHAFEHGRLKIFTMLADLVVRRDVLAAVALIQERDAELERWRFEAAAGDLEGLASLGPDFWPTVQAWPLSGGRRNDRCPCGSGVKLKRCCAERVWVRPRDVVPALRLSSMTASA